MDAEKKGATAVPPAANDEGTPTPGSKQGAQPSDENLHAENRRMAEKIKKLEERLEEGELSRTEMLEELEALKSKSKPSDNEDEQWNKLLENPVNKLFFNRVLKEVGELAKKSYSEMSWNDQLQLARETVAEKAEELGMDAREFANAIKPFSAKYNDRSPVKKWSLAMRDYMNEKARQDEINKREEELKRKEEEDRLYAETGSRARRDDSPNKSLAEAAQNNDLYELGDKLADILK